MDLSSEEDWLDRARQVVPGGVASPVRACHDVDSTPVVVDEARGARIQGTDGQGYIDLVSAYGAIALGHGHPSVTQACLEAANHGLNTGTPNPEAIRLAERLVDPRPSADWLRFVNSGTEAVMRDRKSTRLNSSHSGESRMPSSA